MAKAAINETLELEEEHFVLVKRIARHMATRLPSTVRLEDLMQSGMVGLLEAQGKFDETKGANFSTYASIRIRGAMIDELRRGDWAPRSVHRHSREVAEARHAIETEIGRRPKDTEIALRLGITLGEYHQQLKDSAGVKVYEYKEGDSAGDAFEAGITRRSHCPLSSAHQIEFRDNLAKQIAELPERERLILALYYDEDLNLREIGDIIGVTESRVSQIHSQAMLRLQGKMGEWRSEIQ